MEIIPIGLSGSGFTKVDCNESFCLSLSDSVICVSPAELVGFAEGVASVAGSVCTEFDCGAAVASLPALLCGAADLSEGPEVPVKTS